MSLLSRPILSLLCGLFLFTISMAVLNTLVPLWLAHEALSTWQIGMVSSGYFLGNLIGTLIAGLLINRFGFNHSYSFACLLFTLAAAGLGIGIDFVGWFGWRLLSGIACAVIWVVVESVLLRSGTTSSRSTLLAAYMVTYYIGTVFGQLLLNIVPTQLMTVLPWVTTLLLMALLPLLFVKLAKPEIKERRYTIRQMFALKVARTGILGCVISGMMLGILYGLLPVYLSSKGLNDNDVAYWIAVFVISGIVGQLPMGKLAEKYGRLSVLRIQSVMVILACLIALYDIALIAPVLMMLGFFASTLYPLAMSWACEKVSVDELVPMNQTLLLSYTIGSLVGPPVTAFLMQHYSQQFIFITVAITAFSFLTMLFYRKHYSQPVVAS